METINNTCPYFGHKASHIVIFIAYVNLSATVIIMVQWSLQYVKLEILTALNFIFSEEDGGLFLLAQMPIEQLFYHNLIIWSNQCKPS